MVYLTQLSKEANLNVKMNLIWTFEVYRSCWAPFGVLAAVEGRPHTHRRERRGMKWSQVLPSCQKKGIKVRFPLLMTMYDKPKRLRLCTARHNRKPDRMEETQCNLRLPDVQTVLPSVTRCSSKICLTAQRLGSSSSPLQHTHFLRISSFLKGWRQQRLSSPFSQIKREHTQAGLDSHLKTLYSLTLVLLFSLSFSQSRAWPAHSMWFICLLGCLCQIGNISKHLGLSVQGWM